MFTAHEGHQLLPAFVELLVCLTSVLPVPLTHFTKVFILQVEGVSFLLHDFQPVLEILPAADVELS